MERSGKAGKQMVKYANIWRITNEQRSDSRDLLAKKSKLRYLQRKKDLAVVNNYRKFEEIIFTNNRDVSV